EELCLGLIGDLPLVVEMLDRILRFRARGDDPHESDEQELAAERRRGRDCELDGNLAAILRQRGELQDFAENGSFASGQVARETGSVCGAMLRGNDRVGEDPP